MHLFEESRLQSLLMGSKLHEADEAHRKNQRSGNDDEGSAYTVCLVCILGCKTILSVHVDVSSTAFVSV